MSPPVLPGRWPPLGDTPSAPRRGFGLAEGLRAHGDLQKVYLDSVTAPANLGKGAILDKLRQCSMIRSASSVNSEGDTPDNRGFHIV